jgi:hypothetical protein
MKFLKLSCFQMKASPHLHGQPGFSISANNLRYTANGGKVIRLTLMSSLQAGHIAMTDFSRDRLKQLPLLQPLALLIKQLLHHNNFDKLTLGTPLETSAVVLLANCYLTSVEAEATNWNLGDALLGFLEHQCAVNHQAVVFGVNGSLNERPSFLYSDELFVLMPGTCEQNCAAGFRNLPLLKEVFQHALEMLYEGVPLRYVLSAQKFKIFSLACIREGFSPSDSVYIGGLPPKTSQVDVSRLVASVLSRPAYRVIVRQKSPRSLKYSFVWLGNVQAAQRCIEALHGRYFDGRRMHVNFAAPSSKRMAQKTAVGEYTEGFESTATNMPHFQLNGNTSSTWYAPAVFPPPLTPPFPMVMVPVPQFPGTGAAIEHIPFCMPPPQHNTCILFDHESDGNGSDVGSNSLSDDYGNSSSDDDEQLNNENKNCSSAKKQTVLIAVDKTGTSALKLIMGL